jgi:serine/threonine-protein kinase
VIDDGAVVRASGGGTMGDPSRDPEASAGIGTDPTLSSESGKLAAPTEPPLDEGATAPALSGALPRASREDLVGQLLDGRYTVLERLGAGGMSVVYLARHELLKKPVAVKVLREELAQSKASLSRFHREARAAASIGDPHIVDVTDYGFTDRGDAYIVMERLEGRDLRRAIAAEGTLAAGRAVAIARQILRALQAAHARGIIHRDLKAENVFLTQRDGHDFVKLLDFGISKITQPLDDAGAGATAATGTGVVMGTPQYIAPEQAHGAQDLDHRVDIYAMGVILYEMLTGALPFTGRSPLEIVMKHVQEEPQPPRARRPDLALPVELERVVLKAMAKDPAQRYQSADEMLAALPHPQSLPGGFASGAVCVAVPARRSHWTGAVAGATLALLAAGGVAVWVIRSRPEHAPVTAGALADAAARGTAGKTPPPDAGVARDLAVVTIKIRVQPESAEIWCGNHLLGRGKADHVVARSATPMRFTLSAPGYKTRHFEVLPDESRAAKIELARSPAPKKRSKGALGDDLAPVPYRKR